MVRVFKDNAELLHIETKAVPVESANSMSIIERYHGPVRREFKIIKSEAPDLSDEEILQLAIKSINDSVGPGGIIPTLQVYGALPRLGFNTDKSTPTMQQRAISVRKATQEMTKHFARTQISGATRTRNGPDTSDIRNAPVNTPVLVYRPGIDTWDGVFRLQWFDGEDCYVLLPPPSGLIKFRSTVVKRYLEPESTTGNESSARTPDAQNLNSIPSSASANTCIVSAFKISICNDHEYESELIEIFKKQGIPQSKDNRKYEAFRNKELNGLVE